MARRRLLTILASTLAAGLVALPASALPLVDDTPIEEPVETVVEPIEEVVAPVEETVPVDSASEEPSEPSASDDEGDGDDGGLLPTGEGEVLEPLAPITDPVEEALAPVLDPVEEALVPAEPVTDVIDEVVDTATGGDDAPNDTGVPAPTAPVTSSGSAGSNSGGVLEAYAPSAPATAERQSFEPYWARQSAGDAQAKTDTTPEVATIPDEAVEAPEVASDEAVLAVGPTETDTSADAVALKMLAAMMVAGTGYLWTRVNAAQKSTAS